MRSYAKLVVTQLKLLTREPVSLFFTIAFPSLFFLLMGSVFGNMAETGAIGTGDLPDADAAAFAANASRFAYGVDQYVPALFGLLLGTIALNTIPVATANSREQGILRRFKATPMPSQTWMASQITAYFLMGVASATLLTTVANLVFDVQLPPRMGLVVGAFTLSAFAFMAFGYLVASLSPNARSAAVAGQLLYMPMIFVSGATMPLSMFPDGIRAVSQWLPMTHIVVLMQETWAGQGLPLTSVGVLLGILVIGGALSASLFRWD